MKQAYLIKLDLGVHCVVGKDTTKLNFFYYVCIASYHPLPISAFLITLKLHRQLQWSYYCYNKWLRQYNQG